jgi:hypothetical protein
MNWGNSSVMLEFKIPTITEGGGFLNLENYRFVQCTEDSI